MSIFKKSICLLIMLAALGAVLALCLWDTGLIAGGGAASGAIFI